VGTVLLLPAKENHPPLDRRRGPAAALLIFIAVIVRQGAAMRGKRFTSGCFRHRGDQRVRVISHAKPVLLCALILC